jgi:hypothetical protein
MLLNFRTNCEFLPWCDLTNFSSAYYESKPGSHRDASLCRVSGLHKMSQVRLKLFPNSTNVLTLFCSIQETGTELGAA